MQAFLNRVICMVVLAAASCVGVLASEQAPATQQTERELLRLMEKGRRATYAGIQKVDLHLHQRRSGGAARVEHLKGYTRTEILSPDAAKGTVILQHRDKRWIRKPGGAEWRPLPSAGHSHFWSIPRNYAIAAEGAETVAGRRATVVMVRSRASGKPARRYWVDRQTGVVLRTEVYNWEGRLVSTAGFEEIDFEPRLDARNFQRPEPQRPSENAPIPENVAFPRPTQAPTGYRLVGQPRWVQMETGQAVHLRYTDGLNGISVFVRKLQPGETPRGRKPRGPKGGGRGKTQPELRHPFSSVVHYVKGDYRVTLIGDIDPAELRRMAESIE